MVDKKEDAVVRIPRAEAQAFRKQRSGGAWHQDIVSYLISNQGSTDIEVYNGTRQDRLDISDGKKKHNIASAYKALRDEGYIDVLEGKGDDAPRYMVLVPDPTDKDYNLIVKGQESRAPAAYRK